MDNKTIFNEIIQDILKKEEFSVVDSIQIDFILFRKRGEIPLIAIEIDNAKHDKAACTSKDKIKNRIFEKLCIPLLCIETDKIIDKERINQSLRDALKNKRSIFCLLDEGNEEKLMDFLQKHGRISEHDSENVIYGIIKDILGNECYNDFDCIHQYVLKNLVKNMGKDFSILEPDEAKFAKEPLAQVDFIISRRMDKKPLLAIEVDGAAYHVTGSDQAIRDEKKNNILAKLGIPLLRLRTDGSMEKERIEEKLREILSK